MNRVLAVVLPVLTFLAAPSRLPAQETAPAPAGPETVRKLVAQLGADGWADRNAAAIALERMGPDAFEALHRAASESDDPEIRHRAGLVLSRGVWKGIPHSLEEIFLGFFRKPAREKAADLGRLVDERPAIGALRLGRYLERVFLYDSSPEVRSAALLWMGKAGILPNRGPLARLGKARTDPWSRRRIGCSYSRSGFPAEAIEFLGPSSPEPEGDLAAAVERARSLTALGRAAEAAAILSGLPADPEEGPGADPRVAIDTLLAARRPDEALSRFLEIFPEQERAVRFAVRLSTLGFPDAALKALEGSATSDAEVLALRILARAGKGAEAARRLEVAIGNAGLESPAGRVALRALAVRGFAGAALEALDRAEREGRPSASLLVERAWVLARAGRGPEAEALLRSEASRKELAVALPEIVRAAAFLLEDAGNAGEALEVVESARRLAPETPGLALARAEILERGGRAKEAQEAYLAELPFLEDRNHAFASGAILRLAAAAGGLEELAARLERKMGELEAAWKARVEKSAPAQPPRNDAPRVPVLGLLARVRAEQGKAPEARALCNLAFLLAPASVVDLALRDRMRVEGKIGGPEACKFLTLLLEASPGESRERESPRRSPDLPPDMFKPLIPKGAGAAAIVAHRWAFRDFMNRVSNGDEPLPDPLRLKALEILAGMPGGADTSLLARLAGRKDPALGRAALARLEALPPAEAAPALLECLRKSMGDFPWQQEVIASIARLPAGKAGEELPALAAPGSGRMAALAAWALARRGDAKAANVLEGAARNAAEPAEVRAFATMGLAAPPRPERRELFASLIEDPEPSVRMAAAAGLLLLGDPEGPRAVAREIEFGSRDFQEGALDTASAIGGGEVRRALAGFLHDPDASRDAIVAVLEDAGPPEEQVWRETLDGLIAPDASEGLRLGTFLDALADGADPAACKEGLACWLEILPPGAETGPALARAARLALHAGETAAAERFFRRARVLLEGDESRDAPAALARLLADFRREPEAALRAAAAARAVFGRTPSTADLEARALLSAGRKPEALAVLDEALRELPAPGRPWLARLREQAAGK